MPLVHYKPLQLTVCYTALRDIILAAKGTVAAAIAEQALVTCRDMDRRESEGRD